MRISTTTLESFRIRKSDDEFIEKITGKFIQTEQMKFGSAFDKLITQSPELIIKPDNYEIDGFKIPAEPVNIMINRINYDLANFQLKAVKAYDIDGTLINLVAKTDIITGNIIDEIKTRFSPLNLDSYYNSMQWRCYLDIFEVPIIYYHVFEFAQNFEYKDAYEPFYFGSYSKMSFDIENALYELKTFILNKNLQNYFKENL